jgi:type VI secretion system secreted protein Hcp
MNRSFVGGLLVCAVVGGLSTAGAATVPFYMAVNGSKQGAIKGGTTTPGWEEWIACLGLRYAVNSPVGASGQATGRRQHSAVIVTKRWDRSSPQLFSALTTDEVLPSVEMHFLRAGPGGTQVVFYAIKLTNARVVSIEQRLDPPGLPGDQAVGDAREDVGFVFEKIQVIFWDGGISATDDWGAPQAVGPGTLNPPITKRRLAP